MTPAVPTLPHAAARPQPANSAANIPPGLFDLSLLLADAGFSAAVNVDASVTLDAKSKEKDQQTDVIALGELPVFLLPIIIDSSLPRPQNRMSAHAASKSGDPDLIGLAPESQVTLPAPNAHVVASVTAQTSREAVSAGDPQGAVKAAAGLQADPYALAASTLPHLLKNSAEPLESKTNHDSKEALAAITAPAVQATGLQELMRAVGRDASAGTGQSAQASLQSPVGTPHWRDEFADKVALMTRAGHQTAELSLHPAEMGPIEVRIRLDEGFATITFHVHQALTRDAIEEALPRLREMLGESGINLGQTTVGDQASGTEGRDARQAGRSGANTENARNDDNTKLEPVRVMRLIARGNIDIFA